MSEEHFDEYEHYNFDQEKQIFTGHGGKLRLRVSSISNDVMKVNRGVRRRPSRTPTVPTPGATRGRSSPN